MTSFIHLSCLAVEEVTKKILYFQEDIPPKLLSHDFLSFEKFCG